MMHCNKTTSWQGISTVNGAMKSISGLLGVDSYDHNFDHVIAVL